MLVIQFAKLLHRRRKLRSLDFPSFRPALGGVQNKLEFVRLVNRHGTAPRSHGLKGQRATFLLRVQSGPAFDVTRGRRGALLGNTTKYFQTFLGKAVNAIRQLLDHDALRRWCFWLVSIQLFAVIGRAP